MKLLCDYEKVWNYENHEIINKYGNIFETIFENISRTISGGIFRNYFRKLCSKTFPKNVVFSKYIFIPDSKAFSKQCRTYFRNHFTIVISNGFAVLIKIIISKFDVQLPFQNCLQNQFSIIISMLVALIIIIYKFGFQL